MRKIIFILAILLFCTNVYAADITLKWDASVGATGYRIYRSVDMGATWTMVQETGAVTEFALTGQPDTLTLYRVGAFNSLGDAIRYDAGAWSWASAPKPPAPATGTGIQ